MEGTLIGMTRIGDSRVALAIVACIAFWAAPLDAQVRLIGDPVDVSEDFAKPENVYFVAGAVKDFDAAAATGRLEWRRYRRRVTLDFKHAGFGFVPDTGNEFPPDYAQHPVTSFGIQFVTPRTIRLRIATRDPAPEYTALTGRSPMPPLWSFGLWMSRITYKSEDETRGVAKKLREHRIPADVIHLDTGWFEQVVRNAEGRAATEDAVLDFSNPRTIEWYQGVLAALLKMGVGAIKADFGEDAPLDGLYASGRTGLFEHNAYPLRYNKVVGDITKQVTGESIIWARSAWAGSQRYPLHWGGDAETTDSGMAGTLRGGLSLGLSGFTFWSHDMGGFVERTPRDLYSRWVPFGMLTSHCRAHGQPPKEPWEYDAAFVAEYRRAVELKYALMPYVYAQAKAASGRGHPMLRTLFFEFPDDPTAWLIEDEYLFGEDLLVAPLFESGRRRLVYVPPGTWVDYQSGAAYQGGRWHTIDAGAIPIVLLVRGGAILPHAAVAQHTGAINWNTIELRVYGAAAAEARGLIALPGGDLQTLVATRRGSGYVLKDDPLRGTVNWTFTRR